jgi:hypothetical protein
MAIFRVLAPVRDDSHAGPASKKPVLPKRLRARCGGAKSRVLGARHLLANAFHHWLLSVGSATRFAGIREYRPVHREIVN